MSKIDAVDDVIRKHLGRSDFGLPDENREMLGKFWAHLIVDADTYADLTFEASVDALALEDLRRSITQCLAGIDGLSNSTKAFLSPTFIKWRIAQLLMDKETNPFDEARKSLQFLAEWLDGLSRVRSLRTPARRGKNWRAASVAATCQIVWAEMLWERAGKVPFGETARRVGLMHLGPKGRDAIAAQDEEFNAFMKAHVPNSEKHDAPGPFGRFLEDVFAALEIVGQDGNPFPAASALRSLSQQSKQLSRK